MGPIPHSDRSVGTVRLHAPAKVNLFLRVLAQERSGFHQLETLFCALDFGDRLVMERAPSGIDLKTSGFSTGPVEENLVYLAAKGFLAESRADGGVRIRLEKKVPPGSGLGGGSSDAAATLVGLQRLYPGALSQEDLLRLSGTLGSDVPFFLSASSLALAWGRGDRVYPLPPLPPAQVVLALPPLHVLTPHAYSLLSGSRGERPLPRPPRVFSPSDLTSWEAVGELSENDFEAVILTEYPALGRIKAAFQQTGPILTLLSGSGAALFGVFRGEAAAQEASTALQEEFPDTRFLVTRTNGGDSGPPDLGGGLNRR